MSDVSALYEALAVRETAPIERAVHDFRAKHTAEDLFVALARFGVLAYAPALHAKHALMSFLAVYDLRQELGERFDEMVLCCALYAAESRLPWSEPPILDPPAISTDEPSDAPALRAAVAAGDRLRGERWLAARIETLDLARDYFDVATDDFEDLGHKLIVATCAWRLSALLGEKGRFATLRAGIWEMTSYYAPGSGVACDEPAPERLLGRLIDVFVEQRGSIIAAHGIFLFDAALQAAEIAERPEIAGRVFAHLSGAAGSSRRDTSAVLKSAVPQIPAYRLARDCAASLKMFAVAKRLQARFPEADLDAAITAALYNLEHAPSLEDW